MYAFIKIPFYMMCKKSVQLNERLLKHLFLSVGSFIISCVSRFVFDKNKSLHTS